MPLVSALRNKNTGNSQWHVPNLDNSPKHIWVIFNKKNVHGPKYALNVTWPSDTSSKAKIVHSNLSTILRMYSISDFSWYLQGNCDMSLETHYNLVRTIFWKPYNSIATIIVPDRLLFPRQTLLLKIHIGLLPCPYHEWLKYVHCLRMLSINSQVFLSLRNERHGRQY